MEPEIIERNAVLSADGKYRYRLTRTWQKATSSVALWLMLNPSTADATIDDTTIRKCIGFSQRWGHGGLEVINLFAFRATDPAELLQQRDPVGPEYATHLMASLRSAPTIIAAWGCGDTLKKLSGRYQNRADAVLKVIRTVRPDVQVRCLGANAEGIPYHPARLSYQAKLVPFPVEHPTPEPLEQEAE